MIIIYECIQINTFFLIAHGSSICRHYHRDNLDFIAFNIDFQNIFSKLLIQRFPHIFRLFLLFIIVGTSWVFWQLSPLQETFSLPMFLLQIHLLYSFDASLTSLPDKTSLIIIVLNSFVQLLLFLFWDTYFLRFSIYKTLFSVLTYIQTQLLYEKDSKHF